MLLGARIDHRVEREMTHTPAAPPIPLRRSQPHLVRWVGTLTSSRVSTSNLPASPVGLGAGGLKQRAACPTVQPGRSGLAWCSALGAHPNARGAQHFAASARSVRVGASDFTQRN
jgi:hypothetical protein